MSNLGQTPGASTTWFTVEQLIMYLLTQSGKFGS